MISEMKTQFLFLIQTLVILTMNKRDMTLFLGNRFYITTYTEKDFIRSVLLL